MPINRLKQFRNKHLPKGSFRVDVLTLMTGIVIAQIITVTISPILTRLFSPSDFGIFGVYMSMVSIMTSIVTLCYNQALVLPKDNKDAAHLFWVSLLSVAGVSLLTLILCFLFYKQIPKLLKTPELSGWFLFLPFSIFFIGCYHTLNSWSTRQKQFHRASISQVVRSTTAAGVQVSSGFARTGPLGLISGAIFGDFFSSLTLAFQVKRNDEKVLKAGLQWNSIKQLAWQYSDFPLYSSTQAFLNSVSQNIPLLLLAKFFGPVVVGFYALGVRVIQLPMNLVLTSLRQVLFQKASEVYNSAEDTYGLFKKTTFKLIKIVVFPASIVILFGPQIFSFVLGKEWSIAGEYARWLVLWLAVDFINPSATQFFQIYRKQHVLMWIDFSLLFLRIIILVVGGIFFTPLETIIWCSLAGGSINAFIVIYMWLFLRKERLIVKL